MKYRIQITKDYRGTNYTPQVLKWPEWLGGWKGILTDGNETSHEFTYDERTALANIEAHKKLQTEKVITYRYL